MAVSHQSLLCYCVIKSEGLHLHAVFVKLRGLNVCFQEQSVLLCYGRNKLLYQATLRFYCRPYVAKVQTLS